MESSITILGSNEEIQVDRPDFYRVMLQRIIEAVFRLLGPEFDKEAFLREVEEEYPAVQSGQKWSIPVSIVLSLELGYCLGQLKSLGRSLNPDLALADLYREWKRQLEAIVREMQGVHGPVQ